MTPNVDEVIRRILGHEGGIKDVGDGKGLTRFGQTPDWLKTHKLPVPMTREQAAANYHTWMKRFRLSNVADWDLTVGHLLTDLSVHAGEGTAIRALQRIVGATADGIIGPQTLGLMKRMATERLRRRLLGETIRHGGRVITDIPQRAKYAAGWADRWADHVEALP